MTGKLKEGAWVAELEEALGGEPGSAVDVEGDALQVIPGSAVVTEETEERLVLSAEKEIVLRCGEASITLRADGKIILRGTHLLQRSSGPLRLKGGSVSIN